MWAASKEIYLSIALYLSSWGGGCYGEGVYVLGCSRMYTDMYNGRISMARITVSLTIDKRQLSQVIVGYGSIHVCFMFTIELN